MTAATAVALEARSTMQRCEQIRENHRRQQAQEDADWYAQEEQKKAERRLQVEQELPFFLGTEHGPDLPSYEERFVATSGCFCHWPHKHSGMDLDTVCQPLVSHALPLPSRIRLSEPSRKHLKKLPILRMGTFVSACGIGVEPYIVNRGYLAFACLPKRWAFKSLTADWRWHINETPSVPWTHDAIEVYYFDSNGLAVPCGCHFLVGSRLYSATDTSSREVDISGMPELQKELWRYRIAQDNQGRLSLTPSSLQIGYGSCSRYQTVDYTDGPLQPVTVTFKYPHASKGRRQDEKFPKERGPVLWEKNYNLAGSVFKEKGITLQTIHCAESTPSCDAIAEGEGRAVGLFKEFPAYYAEGVKTSTGWDGEQFVPEGSDESIPKAKVMERMTWEENVLIAPWNAKKPFPVRVNGKWGFLTRKHGQAWRRVPKSRKDTHWWDVEKHRWHYVEKRRLWTRKYQGPTLPLCVGGNHPDKCTCKESSVRREWWKGLRRKAKAQIVSPVALLSVPMQSCQCVGCRCTEAETARQRQQAKAMAASAR